MSDVMNDHCAAIEGWKVGKDQLHKQQHSVMDINDEAEKVTFVAFKTKGRQEGGQ